MANTKTLPRTTDLKWTETPEPAFVLNGETLRDGTELELFIGDAPRPGTLRYVQHRHWVAEFYTATYVYPLYKPRGH